MTYKILMAFTASTLVATRDHTPEAWLRPKARTAYRSIQEANVPYPKAPALMPLCA